LVAGSEVLVADKVGTGLEALACRAAEAMKTASGSSAACLFIDVLDSPGPSILPDEDTGGELDIG
jgi:hypothetical protein